MTDYQSSIHCSVSADRAYQAITHEMSMWWTPMSHRFTNIGDRGKTDFGGPSYWVFEAVTLNRPHLILLECCESNMVSDSLADPEEWLGTSLKFKISEGNEACTITLTLTHIGLNPEMACYEICKAGWDHYIAGSLKHYLDGEGGDPNSY